MANPVATDAQLRDAPDIVSRARGKLSAYEVALIAPTRVIDHDLHHWECFEPNRRRIDHRGGYRGQALPSRCVRAVLRPSRTPDQRIRE
jgi:hypothetical protein